LERGVSERGLLVGEQLNVKPVFVLAERKKGSRKKKGGLEGVSAGTSWSQNRSLGSAMVEGGLMGGCLCSGGVREEACENRGKV